MIEGSAAVYTSFQISNAGIFQFFQFSRIPPES